MIARKSTAVFPLAVVFGLVSLPGAARAQSGMSLTLEGFGGVSHHDLLGLQRDLATPSEADSVKGNLSDLGTSAILRLGGFEVGALWAGGLNFTSAQTCVLGPLVGFAVDPIPLIRLELLGEAGGHQVRNLGGGTGPSDLKTNSTWLPYAGTRLGVSLRFPVGPMRLMTGVWGFARWDLMHRQVTVSETGSDGAVPLPYNVGGSSMGLAGRFGIEF